MVYAPAPMVQKLLSDPQLKLVGIYGFETVLVAGESQALRQFESTLRTRGIQFQASPQPRVQSLIPFLSENGIQNFLLLLFR